MPFHGQHYLELVDGIKILRSKRVAENALKLDPHNASIYVLLSNIYSDANRWDDASKVILKMKENGIKKIPGQTWIEINGEIHTLKLTVETANISTTTDSIEIFQDAKKAITAASAYQGCNNATTANIFLSNQTKK
jgi:pentatricopeptide repeat protein